MKFNNYDIEDFLSDKDFIEWVKGGESLEKNIYFKQWINSSPENLNKAYLAREILLSMKSHSLTPTQEDYDEVLSAIINPKRKRDASGIEISSTGSKLVSLFWIRAAIFLLLATFSIVFYFITQSKVNHAISYHKVIKSNPRGQHSKFKLPDGSKVWLNAESQVIYSENFGSDTRYVELSGEAFFEVKKDPQHPFIVKSGSVTTRALGTAFNVNAYDAREGVEVSLVHGRVEVKDTVSSMKIILTPGEKVVGNRNEFKKSLFDNESISWKDGVILFKKADLKEVTGRLSRWYDVDFKIVNDPGETWVYNGSFEDMSLSKVLERMSFTEDFTYEIKDKVITLKFKSRQ